jgi:hypothetical protein
LHGSSRSSIKPDSDPKHVDSSRQKSRRLSPEDKKEIIRRLKAGDTLQSIGADFGVTRQAISLIRQQVFEPEKVEQKRQAKLKKRLTDEQSEEFARLLDTTTPGDHGLVPAQAIWTVDLGTQLAHKLYGKTPSVSAMKAFVGPIRKKAARIRDSDPKPQPPEPHHINQLSPELAKDKDFVAYYLSPVCEKIAWREYEIALAEWEKRNAGREPGPDLAEDEPGEPDPEEMAKLRKLAAKRPGKAKGSNFTPPKRRKRRKKR